MKRAGLIGVFMSSDAPDPLPRGQSGKGATHDAASHRMDEVLMREAGQFMSGMAHRMKICKEELMRNW